MTFKLEPVDRPELHESFLRSTLPHVVMITNHGIHQWKIIPGLPDTGGQNVFVNQFTESVARLGFRVTIVNRGGFKHPKTGELHRGLRYKSDRERILYVEDGDEKFIRKEDIDAQLPALQKFLSAALTAENTPVDLIISHYWDAAKLGIAFNKTLPKRSKHIWVPHSLGTIKKQNMLPEAWAGLRIEERITIEKALIKDLDAVASTSGAIQTSLAKDYGHETSIFLPPCVDPTRYHNKTIADEDPIWNALTQASGMPIQEIKSRKIVAEVSRTDETKRKNVLIEAFGRAQKKYPKSFLIVTIDDTKKELAQELSDLIDRLGIRKNTAVLGSCWDLLPALYSLADIYCTPSVMEGFGMSIQEAAACETAAVSSDLVPFAVEYLLGKKVAQVQVTETGSTLRLGEGAIIAKADDIPAFTKALEILLEDDNLCTSMGVRAREITVPYFTWEHMTRSFLESVGVKIS